MQIEGRLRIDLYPNTVRAQRVVIRSSRPLQAARIFTGKRAEQVLTQLPLLFSICGIAQATAAMRALRQALGGHETAGSDRACALLVAVESAREHLWRILLDWPALLGETPNARLAASIQPLPQAFRQALFADGEAFSLHSEVRADGGALETLISGLERLMAEQVFDGAVADWCGIDGEAALYDWARRADTVAARLLRQVIEAGWQSVGRSDVPPLPALPVDELNRRLAADDAERFIAEPRWKAQAHETTALTQQAGQPLIQALQAAHGNGLLTRLAARLAALAGLPACLRRRASELDAGPAPRESPGLPDGIGIGQVEAARGRLVHRVELADTRVRRYQILAPTEWNFHPDGALARGLAGLPAADSETLQCQAALLVNALDPCVGHELKVH